MEGMKKVRSTWTDSRLDDLNDRVSELGNRVDAGFTRIDGRIDALQHTILRVGGALLAAVITLIATQL